ncbi:NCS1 nucleoside transporter [Colletotrichum cuscutae]|uniref:NCS1 nucleoside transporter n=1 Tax=Colletotrichum cuscutae TaxID=1209917 RepID=A0AAI9XLZ0_9PEZI|nr:NCS1 nucleoside transporter [Colletotrichum cuscutae]
MFENVCSNAVAGGIDLAGLFPRYLDIRRGALLTFAAAWIIQPWQLINQAATFVAVLNSFAVFLAPIMGVMVCDYFVLRRRRVRLTHLFSPEGSDYWYQHGINWRVIPCWVAGWAPTVGGLIGYQQYGKFTASEAAKLGVIPCEEEAAVSESGKEEGIVTLAGETSEDARGEERRWWNLRRR